MILPKNVYIIMSIYVEGKELFLTGNGLTVVLSQLGSCLAQMNISPTMNLRLNFIINFTDYLLYEGVISAIKCYQKKLGIEWKDDFAADDAPVWKCLLKGGVNGIYARLVKIVTDPNV